VEWSLLPSLVGETLRRDVRLEVDELVLGYDVEGRKHRYRYELRWTRP
jgi:hypothetical protein